MPLLSILSSVSYNSVYLLLSLILLALILITPADIIRQALPNDQRFQIFFTSISYVAVIVIVVFIYFTRLFVHRSALASIPKKWVPIEKGDVKTKVRKMIERGLARSAIVAFEARPRVKELEDQDEHQDEGEQDKQEEKETRRMEEKDKRNWLGLKQSATTQDDLGATIPPHHVAVWGEIEHSGWASPNSPDLADLQYERVIAELPNLLEGQAMSLVAPSEDLAGAVILQRAEHMSLREYLSRLAGLGVLDGDGDDHVLSNFTDAYEHARYSTRLLSTAQFRHLMHHFAELLRVMKPLNPSTMQQQQQHTINSDGDSDIDNDTPLDRSATATPRSERRSLHTSHRQRRASIDSHATVSTAGKDSMNSDTSRVRMRPTHGRDTARSSYVSAWAGESRSLRTVSRRSRRTEGRVSPAASVSSFAQTRAPYNAGMGVGDGDGSRSSLSVGGSSSDSNSVGSGGSVIRLADSGDMTDLPYVIATGSGRIGHG